MAFPDPEVLALHYLDLTAFQRLGLYYGLIVLGGCLGGVLWRGDAMLTRGRYVFGLGGIAFCVGASQMVWLLYPMALKAGQSYLPALSDLGGAILLGMALSWLAKARSRDIAGDTAEAWRGFMPPIGCHLMKKPSKYPDPGTIGVPFVIIGLVLMTLGRIVGAMAGKEVEHQADAYDPAIDAAFESIHLRDIGLETGLNDLIAATGTPYQIGPTVALTQVTRDGLHLTYHFTIDQHPDHNMHAHIASGYCDNLKTYLDQGASVSLDFANASGALVEALNLTPKTCTI